jgi:RNA polymerase sigma-70 factor (family 1)
MPALTLKYLPVYNEHELLIRLQADDAKAFTELFDHYRGRIYGVALKFLKSPVLAEEIVQDVFLKVWLKRSEMAAVTRFDAYLFVMARNFIFDRIKKMAYESAAQSELLKQPSVNDADHLLIQRQYQQLLQQAIDLLPPQQKQVYHLAKVEGLSHEAIAEKMLLSRLTVKAHMAKALRSIRKYLNTHLHHLIALPFFLEVLTGSNR